MADSYNVSIICQALNALADEAEPSKECPKGDTAAGGRPRIELEPFPTALPHSQVCTWEALLGTMGSLTNKSAFTQVFQGGLPAWPVGRPEGEGSQ
jgi:hypothetical protein